jgi:hypothetical protein
MGEPLVRRITAINLDPSLSGLPKPPNHLWDCPGIRFAGIPTRESLFHSLTVYG